MRSARLAVAFLSATMAAPIASGDGAVAVASLAEPADLASAWRFRIGDDLGWAAPSLDDGGWERLRVPGDWGRQGHAGYAGLAWYRLSVQLSGEAWAQAQRHGLALTLGRVHSAYEAYAGGVRIGGVGRLPPDPVVHYDRDATWPVPVSAVADDGTLVLALRVWRGPGQARAWQGGPYEGSFLLGATDQLVARAWRGRLLSLVLTATYLLIGLYHIHLYRRAPALRAYLWYGLLTIAIGSYAYLISAWKHDLGVPWVLLKRLEYAMLDLLPALCLQAVWALVDLRPGRLLRLYRESFLLLAAAALVAPSLPWLFATLDFWQVWMLPALFGLVALVAARAVNGHPEARTILVGVVAFAATAANDVAVDRRLLETPRLVPIGFSAFILSMAVSLANRFTRVFAELEARTRELQRAQADLLRTEKMSAIGGMAAGLVHDLRNPVGAIGSYAGLIAARSTPEQRNMLQRIQDETQRCLDMMEDVLAFARSSVRAQPATVDLAAWLGEIRDYLQRALEMTDVAVTLRGDVTGPARLDPGRMRRVICNLAWNSRDAMPAGGRFEIAVARSEGALEIACTDSGPGVPAEFRARLFGEFATFGKPNGTGLGLALSRRVVEEHGGTLRYEDAPGGGARFVAVLPQPNVSAAPKASGAP